MTTQRQYVVHCMGNDAVGLVGRITSPIAAGHGNIVDLRQDVLHGLFTIYMVVDLTESNLELEAFETILREIGDDTGLKISVDRYSPVPRSPEKKSLLIICVGRDKPGIIAASSKMLGQYNANIEFSNAIGREGIFLMELLADVSHVTIPVENLRRTIREQMDALHIRTVFQDEHVFIKRKRLIVFHLAGSFLGDPVLREILRQTGVSAQELAAAYARQSPLDALRQAASRLDGLPLEVIDRIMAGVSPTSGTTELIQTLKVLGYKVGLVSRAFAFLTERVRQALDLDHAYGVCCEVDDDARALVGELNTDDLGGHDAEGVLARLTEVEGVDREDIAVIHDEGCEETPGIRLDVNLEILLDCFNKRTMSRENLIGLLGSLGTPRLR